MSTFGQCLRAALKLRRMSQRALAGALGVSTVYLNRICQDVRLPSMELFYQLCDALSLTPAEFFAGGEAGPALRLTDAEAALILNARRLTEAERRVAGDMIAALAGRTRPRALAPSRRSGAARYTRRAVSGYAAAGLPLFDATFDGEIDIPAKYADGERYLLCTARGTSMQPDIMDGDVVVVERYSQAESGMTALVHIESATSADGEYTIKRFYPFADHAELRSVNPEHPTMVYPSAAILTAERVVHVIRRGK